MLLGSHRGISPYEPIFSTSTQLPGWRAARCSGCDRAPPSSWRPRAFYRTRRGWTTLASFVRALGLDAFGGTVADAPPSELARVLRTSWGCGSGPTGMVVAGLPSLEQQVA
jgi:hypothetical protein